MLPFEPATAETQDRPPARDVVERRRELRRQAGIAERIRAHQQAKANALRERRDRGQRGPALELGVVPVALVRQQVIVQPQRIPAGLLDRQAGVPQGRPVGSLDPERRAELHRHRS